MAWRLMVATAFLGGFALVPPVNAQRAPAQPKASLGILVSETPPSATTHGVTVRAVSENGAAGKAGIHKGDLITRVGTEAVQNYEQLEKVLAAHKPGQKLPVTVTRNGKEKTVQVTLGERGNSSAAMAQQFEQQQGNAPRPRLGSRPSAYIGVEAEPLTPEMAHQMGIQAEHGAVVRNVTPDSPAAAAKLETGDVITEIDGKPVEDITQLRSAVESSGVGKTITLTVLRQGKSRHVKVTLKRAPANFRTPQAIPGFPPGGFGNGNFGPGGFGNFGPGGFGNLGPRFGTRPGTDDQQQRIDQLERQVRELQRRLNALEKKENATPSK